jgi:hypothetical protein
MKPTWRAESMLRPPRFEQSEETRESCFQCDDRLVCALFDVHELDYVAKRIDGTQGMKI